MRVSKLDAYVEGALMQAAADHEPHVEAVILGDSRYQDALAAVDEARQAFEEFRDSVTLQRELGIDGFAKGLKVRKQALELTRRELAKVRPPTTPASGSGKHGKRNMTFDEFIAEYERDRNAQFIHKIILKPAGRVGSRVPPVEQRVDVYFAGSDKPAHPASKAEVVARHQAHLQRERERLGTRRIARKLAFARLRTPRPSVTSTEQIWYSRACVYHVGRIDVGRAAEMAAREMPGQGSNLRPGIKKSRI